jgi:hypothetical protein
MNGRNFGAVMRIVPGVENDVSTANGQVIGGQRSDQYTYTLDGVTMEDSGCGCFAFRYSVDSIAEIMVATNGLAADHRQQHRLFAMVRPAICQRESHY